MPTTGGFTVSSVSKGEFKAPRNSYNAKVPVVEISTYLTRLQSPKSQREQSKP